MDCKRFSAIIMYGKMFTRYDDIGTLYTRYDTDLRNVYMIDKLSL